MASAPPTLGLLLRKLRGRHGWTLKQMSENSGIPLSTLSKVEHDRLTLTYDKLFQVSQRLGIPISELFAEGGQDFNPNRHRAQKHRQRRRCAPRRDSELRLFFPVHGASSQADDPGHHEDPGEDLGRVR